MSAHTKRPKFKVRAHTRRLPNGKVVRIPPRILGPDGPVRPPQKPGGG